MDNLLESRNACIFLLTFTGFFRIEVLHIEYDDVIINDGYVAINLNISKTDQLRKGNQVVIAATPNRVTCLVKIFKSYLSQVERFLVNAGHYFFLRALAKTRFSHTLVSVKYPIIYSSIRDYFNVVSRILFLAFSRLVYIL